MTSPEPGKRIEVHITDADRLVEVALDEGHEDGVHDDVADALVRALDADDPRTAEQDLASALDAYGTVRRGP